MNENFEDKSTEVLNDETDIQESIPKQQENNSPEESSEEKKIKSILRENSVDEKLKKKVKFNKVDLYRFERCQGYLSIPSSDNDTNSMTLGMSYSHNDFDSFQSQEEFLKFKRKMDLDKIEEYINSFDNDQLPMLSDPNIEKVREVIKKRAFYEENIDQDLGISPDILCPILSLDQRLEKLYNLGYLKEEIDKGESREINIIRESRKTCGCICSKLNLICGENGDICSCYANGINCQIDRIKFPCSCNIKRCKNLYGMKRFNPKAVLDHYKKVLHQEAKAETITITKAKGRKRKTKQSGASPKRKKPAYENKNNNENISTNLNTEFNNSFDS